MPKFLKKPTAVEAFQFRSELFDSDDTAAMPRWLIALALAGAIQSHEKEIAITTPDGILHVVHGDWIVKEGDRITSYTDELFRARYEAAE